MCWGDSLKIYYVYFNMFLVIVHAFQRKNDFEMSSYLKMSNYENKWLANVIMWTWNLNLNNNNKFKRNKMQF